MVDETLPLRSLFLDLNSYFASVEQNEDPSLRGKPIAVVPMDADSTCVIAASYPAKKYGIKTGTLVGEAKRMCPDLVIKPATPALYTHYHRRVLEVAESVLPVEKVCSIDEMRFELIGKERNLDEARKIALNMKAAILEHVGPAMTCSVGIAPNGFLAKLATDMQKPDGLVIITKDRIPSCFEELKLTDFAGINKRMQARLNAAGIFTPAQMFAQSPKELRAGFGSIVGERWWYLLRGFQMSDDQESRKSLSHSHVLPPDLRTDQGCKEVLLRLLQKASARLRANSLWAGHLSVGVQGFDQSWRAEMSFPPTQDTVTFNDFFLRAWEKREFNRPRQVGIVFGNLKEAEQVNLSLFDPVEERSKLNNAVDNVNQKFGKNTIYLAGMQHAKDAADEKIAFNKTWLFKEGKDDHEWPDTFRGLAE